MLASWFENHRHIDANEASTADDSRYAMARIIQLERRVDAADARVRLLEQRERQRALRRRARGRYAPDDSLALTGSKREKPQGTLLRSIRGIFRRLFFVPSDGG